jgi:hypothetical protein
MSKSTVKQIECNSLDCLGECSTPFYSNSTQTCGETEPESKCSQHGFQCIKAPFSGSDTKSGRCLPGGQSAWGTESDIKKRCEERKGRSNTLGLGYGDCPDGGNTSMRGKQRCGGLKPGQDPASSPSLGTCPAGSKCSPPPGTKCANPMPYCSGYCTNPYANA